jgi:putative molybdopterin biosynthesis protein
MAKKIYLEDIPLSEAWARLIKALEAANRWGPLEPETVPLEQGLNRVTAAPVWAKLSAPHYHAAAMDGFAVRAADTAAASDNAPVQLRAGPDGPARYVDTGDPLPTWANAVIPIEDAQALDGAGRPATAGAATAAAIEVRAGVAPRQHVRLMGEDMVATELVLPANHTLRPVDLGALAGCGHTSVPVYRRPRVAVIPTGSELVAAGAPVRPGDIIEYNSLVLAAQAEHWGAIATRYPIVPDDFEKIKATVSEAAAGHDLVLLNAGSSAGSEDFSARVVEALGRLLVHGIAVRPGHPVILGMVQGHTPGNGHPPGRSRPVPIIGVPGYPVSAALTGEIFVEPLLAKWRGQSPAAPTTLEAVITRKVLSPMGDDEYVRVTLGQVGESVVATPLARGAGVITSLVRADGLVLVPRHSEGLDAGDRVSVRLYRPADEIARTVVHIGSHDLTLDLLAQLMAERGARLSSANVGSQAGLVALRRGEAHLAGSHLLDPETGEYNLAYLPRYLPDTPVVLVQLVGRDQGLIVRRGNPKAVYTLSDLYREDVAFVNRQRGAGTRVLLDYELGKLAFKTRGIKGYDYEEYTHLAVAAAVASGAVDCGLGIAAAAHALDLDFVPLFKERYDLVIPRVHYEGPVLRPLLDVLAEPRFREQVAALPGYDVRHMGEIVAEVN